MIALITGLLLAAAILVKALLITLKARQLRARLLPVQAHVTRRGDTAELRVTHHTNSDGDNETRHEHVYSGAWDYTVGGRRHEGSIESNAPVFRADQMPPATIEVFYDRDAPSVSRLSLDADRGEATPWLIFAGVAAVVGLMIALIGGL
jgi:hypothetical protein